MKKIIIIWICIMLMSTVPLVISEEPMDASYTELAFNDVTCTVGDSISLDLLITPQDGEYIDTVEILEMTYTTNKINCTGFTWGNLFEGATMRSDPEIDDTGGYINNSLWSYSNTSTPGYFCNFSFDTYQVGTAHLNIIYSSVGIANGGTDLPKKITNNATITIEPQDVYTVYVDDDAPTGWYDYAHVATITEGIANVSAGGTVYVYDGYYNENFDIDKSLNLIGNGSDTVEVEFLTTASYACSIEASDVLIEGIYFWQDGHPYEAMFTVPKGGTWEYYEIVYYNITFSECDFYHGRRPMMMYAGNFTVKNCSFVDSYRDSIYGIFHNAVFEYNYFEGGNKKSILFEGGTDYPACEGNITIRYNKVYEMYHLTVWGSWGNETDKKVNLKIYHNSIDSPGSKAISFFAPTGDEDDFTKFTNIEIFDNIFTNAEDCAVFIDYDWGATTNNPYPSEGQIKCYNNMFYNVTNDTGTEHGGTERYGYMNETNYNGDPCVPENMSMDAYNYSNDVINTDGYIWADENHTNQNFSLYGCSGAIGEASDGSNIGVYQGPWYEPCPNNPPVIADEEPTNNSLQIPISLTYQVNITDANGDLLDWSIECSNGQTNSGTDEAGGIKTLALSGLSEATTYTVWVNASDDEDSDAEIFTFTTGASELWVDDDADPGWYDSTHLDNIPDAIDTIFNNGTINVYNGTYTLTDELYIDRPMDILGENKDQTIIKRSGGNEHRLLTIEDIWDNYVTVDGFTFQGGYANMTNRNGIGGNILIVNSLNATVNNSIIKDGFAEQYGGGIQLEAGGNLKNSTIYDCDVLNSGMNGGGGISMRYGGNIVENCFITNCSGPVGGGILLKMGAYPPNQNQIIHCTIANNTAHGYAGAYYGGGVASQGSGWTTSEIHDSIVYHNSPNNIMDVDGSLNIYYTCTTPSWGGSGSNNNAVDPGFLYTGNYYEYDYYSFTDTSSCWQNASDSLNRGAWQPLNQAPVFGTPNPEDGAVNTSKNFFWEIPISDPDSDPIDWTIECTSGDTSSGTAEGDGTKQLHVVCDFDTTYTIYVNATDDTTWTRDVFTFTTKKNQAPVISSPNPPNSTGGIAVDLSELSVYILDPDGHLMNYTIELSTGNYSTENYVVNGTKTCDIPMDLDYNINYIWWVNVTDGYAWTRETFNFTTKDSAPPVTSNPSPYNGETDVSVDVPNFNIQISDPDGDTFDWNITCNNGDSFSDTTDTDATKFCWFPEYLEYNTTYTIWVNVTENTNIAHSLNEIYTFTTEENEPPTIDLNFPINLTEYLSVYNLLFNCSVFDPGPEELTVEFYINSTLGLRTGYVYNASDGEVEFYLNSLGGTWWLTHFIDHEWWVVVDDGNTRVESEHWTFGTSAPADINEDRTVNYLDVSRLVDDYGESGWFMPGEIGEDIIEDGTIQYQDVSSLVFHYFDTY